MRHPHPFALAGGLAVWLVLPRPAGAIGLPDVPNAHWGRQLPSTESFEAAVTGGSPEVWLRLRYEAVDDDLPAGHPNQPGDEAELWSLRTVLGYSTARWHGFYARLELEANVRIGDDEATNLDEDFTIPPGPAGSIAREGHAIIPDNDFEEINHAFIAYRGPDPATVLGQTTVKLGRQEIVYDNQRWVGNVIWRQNNASFDALRIDNTSIPKLGLSYAYVDTANRLFGDDSIFDEYEMEAGHLLNAAYLTPYGKLSGYYYALDFEDNPRTDLPAPGRQLVEGVGAPGTPFAGIFDSETWGVRFVGRHPLNDTLTLLYEAEWANQDPYKDANPAYDDNDYMSYELGLGFKAAGKPVTLKAGREILESSGVNALQTPFGTVHAFNGWADKFVGAPAGTATPLGGLEDTHVTGVVKGLWGPSTLVFQWHDYEADRTIGGVGDYGEEWSLMFAKPFARHWLGVVKYTDFDADSDWEAAGQFDTRKLWAMVQFRIK